MILAAPPGGSKTLTRVVGVPGAVLMGLGSILGTGIFVGIGIAAEVSGPAVVLAVAIAAAVATFNGLSSAQLAASHPVSGGTYEYGYRYLTPWLGFVAGWMFVCAKSASAATAALGFAGYVPNALGVTGTAPQVAVALVAVVTLTAVVFLGIRQSNRTNTVVVSLTLVALLGFVAVGEVAEYVRGLVAVDGRATAYVCSGFHCLAPTRSASVMLESLGVPPEGESAAPTPRVPAGRRARREPP